MKKENLLKSNFVYNSNTNSHFLNIEEIAKNLSKYPSKQGVDDILIKKLIRKK